MGEVVSQMAGSYADRWIECTADEVKIHGYYFPWGTKHVPYGEIQSVRRVEIGTLTGRARIWGTGNPGYWAHLDPKRPGKKVGLILDLGHSVKPFLTPTDPDAVVACIHEHTGLEPADGEGTRGPII
jgi:hypothetical protein